jgi:hypothetical protein
METSLNEKLTRNELEKFKNVPSKYYAAHHVGAEAPWMQWESCLDFVEKYSLHKVGWTGLVAGKAEIQFRITDFLERCDYQIQMIDGVSYLSLELDELTIKVKQECTKYYFNHTDKSRRKT